MLVEGREKLQRFQNEVCHSSSLKFDEAMFILLNLGTFSYTSPLLCLYYYVAATPSLLLLLLLLRSTDTSLFCPTVSGKEKKFYNINYSSHQWQLCNSLQQKRSLAISWI